MKLRRLSILALVAFISVATYGQFFTPLGLGAEKCERMGQYSSPQMYVEGDILYVCTKQGLYSRNLSSQESTWQLAGFEGVPLQGYVRRGDDILALRYNVNGDFLLLSHDGGKTYEDVTPDLFREEVYKGSRNILTSLVQHPTDPNTLLVLFLPMGLLQSSDFGQTWNKLTNILPDYIGYHPLNPEIIYESATDGIWRPTLNISYDGGQTWNYLNPYYPGDNCINRIAFHPTAPERWIAGGYGAVYTSEDNGYTWDTQVFSENAFQAFWHFMIYDSENCDIVYMAGYASKKIVVTCSTDGGKTWSVPQSEPMKKSSTEEVYDLKQYGDKLLFYTESDVYEISKAELLAQAASTDRNYRPFAQDGKEWRTQVGDILENLYCNRIDGDTLINGERWKKVYNYVYSPGGGYSYYAAIRDVGKKVYAIAKGSDRPRLLYDFGLKVGDMVKCGVEGNAFGCLLDTDEKLDTLLGFEYSSFLRVERIDTIEVNHLQRHHQLRRITLTLLDAFQRPMRTEKEWEAIGNVTWIEGVGSGAGPFSPWMPLPVKGCISITCKDGSYICGQKHFYDDYVADSNTPEQSPTGVNRAAADVNGDGKVDIVDVTSVIDIILTDDNSSSTNKK